MGSIFRQTYTVAGSDGTRETRHSKKWYMEYLDHNGDRQRKPGYPDKQATEQELARLEREAAQIASGLLTPQAPEAKRPLGEQLDEYLDHLRAENDTDAHVALVGVRCKSILTGCKFSTWRNLDPDKLTSFLAVLRRTPRGERKGFSVQTTNHYLRQFRGFATWLARRLKTRDPLDGLGVQNAAADRRIVRRVLSQADFGKLLDSARAGTTFAGLSGAEREALYLTAGYCGFRASELASLAPEHFCLDADPPHLAVDAGDDKSRRGALIPFPPSAAARLAAWLVGKPPGQPVWPGRWALDCRGSEMVKRDLARAGIPYRDARGLQFDFHALRSQYVTGLALAGVSLVEAQRLARHSTPVLTAKHYTRLALEDLGRAAAKLPDPPNPAA